jgi:hypothetical protein
VEEVGKVKGGDSDKYDQYIIGLGGNIWKEKTKCYNSILYLEKNNTNLK